MRVLIVFAHPEHASFNGTMLQASIEALEIAGHSVEVSDLYRESFSAVASRDDFESCLDPRVFAYHLEQKHAHEQGTFAADVKREQDRLSAADLVIFQFPLWWYSVPAILKGWFDRVLACGYAYGDGQSYATGALSGKKALLSVSIGGSEETYQENAAGSLEKILFPIEFGTLRYVGFDVLPPILAFSADYGDPARRAEVIAKVRERLSAL